MSRSRLRRSTTAALGLLALAGLLTGCGASAPSGEQARAASGPECANWDTTTPAKDFRFRARSCGSATDGEVVAAPEVQVEKEIGRAFESFEVQTTITRNGNVVATETCDLTQEANDGTSRYFVAWSGGHLTCPATVSAEAGMSYEVKVDVEYDKNHDLRGTRTAEGAGAVTLTAR